MITKTRRLWVKRKREKRRWLWTGAIVFSALCVLGTIVSWEEAWSRHGAIEGIGTTVTTPAEVDKEVAERFPKGSTVYRVPTGVLMQSFEFLSANNVAVSGLVWQRFNPGIPPEVKRGVVFPEADHDLPEQPDLTFKMGEFEFVGWRFRATVRQKFDYGAYPMDRLDVWLRMRSADLLRPVQLVPDFLSYPNWDSKKLTGLDPEFVQGAWNPNYTVYSMHHIDYGVKTYMAGEQSAELYFNVGVSRALVGPLVGRLVPVILLAVLLFLSLFLTTVDVDRRVLSGFTAFAIIGFAVSTVLVVAVNDNGVRSETGVSGIMYIEFWYFTLYLMTLLVVLNAAFLVSGRFKRLLTWQENLLPKLLFWPIFTSVMFLSALAFYGI